MKRRDTDSDLQVYVTGSIWNCRKISLLLISEGLIDERCDNKGVVIGAEGCGFGVFIGWLLLSKAKAKFISSRW